MSDFYIPWTVNHEAPLSTGFPRQFWSGLPFPSPGDLPDPEIKPWSPALAGRFFTMEPPGKPQIFQCTLLKEYCRCLILLAYLFSSTHTHTQTLNCWSREGNGNLTSKSEYRSLSCRERSSLNHL